MDISSHNGFRAGRLGLDHRIDQRAHILGDAFSSKLALPTPDGRSRLLNAEFDRAPWRLHAWVTSMSRCDLRIGHQAARTQHFSEAPDYTIMSGVAMQRSKLISPF